MKGDPLFHRLAVAADLQAVYDLYMDVDANPYLTYDPMPLLRFHPLFTELLATDTLFVAVQEDEVVGTYRLIPKTHRQAHIWYLGSFTVRSSCKGQGIGKKMLQHIQQSALQHGKKRIELTVDVHNDAAIGLYSKLGFEKEGYIRNSYSLAATGLLYDEYLMAWIAG